MAEALAARGEQADSEQLRKDGFAIAAAVRVMDLFGSGREPPPPASGSDARQGVPVRR
jgi:hypothetical protein